MPRLKGFPLGTSVSLFVANLAAYPLDHMLERLGVGFREVCRRHSYLV